MMVFSAGSSTHRPPPPPSSLPPARTVVLCLNQRHAGSSRRTRSSIFPPPYSEFAYARAENPEREPERVRLVFHFELTAAQRDSEVKIPHYAIHELATFSEAPLASKRPLMVVQPRRAPGNQAQPELTAPMGRSAIFLSSGG